MSVKVKTHKGESLDKLLRRFKKKIDQEDIIKEARAKRYFEKPCQRKRRKEKVAAFNNMLRARYQNM
jgi:small subunit ribosomal protein S21